MSTTKILVTGCEGQLGMALQDLAKGLRMFSFYFANREQLDITQAQSLRSVIDQQSPDYIINTAAYTAVDRAETEPQKAFEINQLGPRLLAEICKEKGIGLIHISTDYVFDGQSSVPYREDDSKNPQTCYGQSKLAGEQEIINTELAKYIILRTSWLYGAHGHNFLKTMLRLGKEGTAVKVVDDQRGIPTSTRDVAKAILTIIPLVNEQTSGVYHYSNSGEASWYDFAKFIFQESQLPVAIEAVTTAQFPTPAKRPSYSVLNCDKIESSFGVARPDWRDAAVSILSIVNS